MNDEIFADAWYYIAVLNPADRFHRAAMEVSKTLVRPVVTNLRRIAFPLQSVKSA